MRAPKVVYIVLCDDCGHGIGAQWGAGDGGRSQLEEVAKTCADHVNRQDHKARVVKYVLAKPKKRAAESAKESR